MMRSQTKINHRMLDMDLFTSIGARLEFLTRVTFTDATSIALPESFYQRIHDSVSM